MQEVRCAPLHQAATRGHVGVAELLIKAGAQVDIRDEFGRAPLHMAAVGGHVGVAELLLKAGAQVDSRDEGGSVPLHWAASGGHVGVAELLLKAGAQVDSRDETGGVPLHKAATKGHVGVAELLLKAGAQVDSRDGAGNTPLSLAAYGGHVGVAEILVAAGAQMDSENKVGETPKDIAASKDVLNDFLFENKDDVLKGRKMILELFETGKVMGPVCCTVGPGGGALQTASCTVSVPRDAVSTETEITCQVLNPNDVTLPLKDGEMLVSDIIELGPHGTTFSEPVTVKMQYSRTSVDGEREAVMWATKDKWHWMQLKPNEKSEVTVAVYVDHFATFAVVSQLKQDQFSVPTEGGTLISTTQPAVKINFPKQAIDTRTEVKLQVQDVPRRAIEDMKAVHHSTRGLIGTSPIVEVKSTEDSTIQFKNPVTVQVPHPENYMHIQHAHPTKLRVQSEDEVESWVDVTEEANVRVTPQGLVEFDVLRSSRWIAMLVEDSYEKTEEIGPIPLQLCKWLQQCDVQFIVMQPKCNPKQLLIECTEARETEEKHARLSQQSYKGPLPSDIVRLFEGQQVQVSLEGNLSFSQIGNNSATEQHITFHSQRFNRLQVLVKAEDGEEGYEGQGYVVFYELPCVVVEPTRRSEVRQALQGEKPDGDIQPPQKLCQLPIHVPYTPPRLTEQRSEQVTSRTATEAPGPQAPWSLCMWMSSCCHICRTRTTTSSYRTLEMDHYEIHGDNEDGVRRHFFFVKENVSAAWKDLSYHLGFTSADEDNIASRNLDDKSCCMDLLNEWLNRKGENATFGVLVQALEDAGLQKVADDLNRRNCQS
ncbi:ankyrin-1-like [Branchiostoma lanceolatum]|uniref:ankyrin-1-like n=1 Tax=Branchiostoma lanceolatum TaxID=7740 RepID=UPI0034532148